MAVTARNVAMNSLLALFLIVVFFIAGFWLGVNTYREQIKKRL
tara:strand:- start:3518 stop:3646 length:129 start_codon:yes stop_codon:yes gene_type:complete